MKRVFQNLSFKLIGGIVVILIIIHTLTGILTIRRIHRNTFYYMDSIGKAISQTAANACIEPFLQEDYPVLETYARQLVHKNPLVVQIQYERQDAKVVAKAFQQDMNDLASGPGTIRVYMAPIEVDGDYDALGYVTVCVSTQSMKSLFRAHLLHSGIILTMSLVFIVILTVVFLRRTVITPVTVLAASTHRIGVGEFDEIIHVTGQDEIGQLAIAFNTMKTNLKASYSAIQQKNDELVTLDKMKSEFLANMSHEIRTPMTAILGFSNLLAQENLTTGQEDTLAAIQESARHLLTLINDILDFSKIEAGKLSVEMIECSLGKLMDSLESMMRPMVSGKSLDFRIVLDPNLPACIKSDPYRLQQCLINLVSNALKFTEQGHVHVKVSLVDDGKPAIRFDVEDTGIGIPKNRQEKVFESFTQADGSTTRKYGGTGLGLTVTKQLVKLLDGRLTFTSECEKGSVFSIIVPVGMAITKLLVQTPQTPATSDRDESIQMKPSLFSGTVLVAEDIMTNQILMKTMLSRMGLTVILVDDGSQAVDKALSKVFDLIIMDMQMPHMNGYEATRLLRQQGYTAPIVALTANAMTGDKEKCLHAGCNDYLTKPINDRELTCVISRYLSTASVAPNQEVNMETPSLFDPQDSPRTRSLDPLDPANMEDIRSIIDWDQLVERLGDEEIIREIMPSYLEDTREHCEKLHLAVQSGDCERIASHAHALKGVGRNLSVETLSNLAAQMEQAGRKNDIEAATLLFTPVRAEIHKVLTVLSRYDWVGG